MSNVFDSTNYPKIEPSSVQVGDRWAWVREDLTTDYPHPDYALSYVLRREITGERIAISATGSSTGYTIEVPSTTTDDYKAGRYHWVAYITRVSDSARMQINTGVVEVTPNRATSSDDPRSFAQIALDNIEAYLKDPSNIAAASYSIAGRSLSRWSRTELMVERDKLKGEVTRERQADEMARGMRTSSIIRVRFTA